MEPILCAGADGTSRRQMARVICTEVGGRQLPATGTRPGTQTGEGRGLLIVNADDWGGYPEMTDVSLECFRVGAVTSATAMMYMTDDERAAELAKAAKMPIGLHLNLTQPFEDPSAPEEVRRRQYEMTVRFRRRQLRRWTYDPFMRGLFEGVINDQLERFHQLYGGPPVHVDGHEHAHLALGAIFSRALPKGTAMRAGGPVNGSPVLRMRRWVLNRRFRTPDYVLPFDSLFPDWDLRLGERLAVADDAVVEIATHPAWDEDRVRLLSPEWIDAIAARRVGSFADLPPG
jgi:chitin disaccharide deacetylase